MKNLVFDTSSIISVATNNLLDVLIELKKKFSGKFIISDEVKREVIDTPLRSKKYKLEAIMISNLLQNKIISRLSNVKITNRVNKLLKIANNIFYAHNHPIKLVDKAEVESLVLAITLDAVYVVDERTMRLMVEDTRKLIRLLERKMNTKIEVDKHNIRLFREETSGIKIIRSSELMTVAYE
ncbi:hypothetical protein K8R47_02335, partial [archaeon]|nr:hypothetical protein [archaeon]